MTLWNMHNAVVFGLLQLAAVTAQTPESVGYPDPRYSTTKSLTAFSCTGGARNCPDAGQYASAGATSRSPSWKCATCPTSMALASLDS